MGLQALLLGHQHYSFPSASSHGQGTTSQAWMHVQPLTELPCMNSVASFVNGLVSSVQNLGMYILASAFNKKVL